VPGPLFASPPLTVQVTLAAPPLESAAVNCSTAAPDELVALQPVQFVSIVPIPGVMDKAPFEFADAPPPHPASRHIAGIATTARTRPASLPPRPVRKGSNARFHLPGRLSFARFLISINAPALSPQFCVPVPTILELN
jgi:hypothetical protein